jgi:cell division protein FtsQ
MKLFSWLNIRLFLMIAFVAGLFSFTTMRNSQRKIKEIDVKIVDKNTPLILPEMVNKLLIENTTNLKTLHKDDLVLKKLESLVNSHKLIQNAQVFMSIDGVLKVVVKQKKPLGRVVGENYSFYLDSEGNEMPLSDNYTARVPLISGEINEIKKEKLSEILKIISEDEFLKKNIIAANVLTSGDIILMNRNYDFKIIFGKSINIQKKFRNYKAFFQKAVSDSILNKYRKINLKFTQQVVGIK